MRHKLKLSVRERIRAWLDLCDFSFRLMRGALGEKGLRKKIEKLRLEHLTKDRIILQGWAKIK